MTAPSMHSQPAGAAPERRCDHCTQPYRPKRFWSRFCGSGCRNAWHAAEAHREQMRAAAPDLYEALVVAGEVIRERGLAAIWMNAPDKPEVTLGDKIDQALAKAGYREPKIIS